VETTRDKFEAVVIGSGPNGLSAAIVLARTGAAVTVREASPLIGGGARSAELTLPGFTHDVCSAVHPLAVSSPFFNTLPLDIQWIHPDAPLAHPLDDGTAVLLERSVDATCAGLGQDGEAWRAFLEPLVERWRDLQQNLLGPPHVPRHPLLLAKFGLRALMPTDSLVRTLFRGERARALFAGIAAHSVMPMDMRPSAAFGMILAVAGHAAGWPIPRGGAQQISDALAGHLRSLGGQIAANSRLETLPDATLVLCDISPRGLLALGGDRFPSEYRRRLREYRYGPGAFKMDWALDGPIPWTARECERAATVHVGGTLAEIAASERAAWEGRVASRPFVLLSQPTLFDPTRAPSGKHTAWAYCHVPNGSTMDMTDAIESQVERFAPGFRRRILARSVLPPAALQQMNPNLVGGDINGGAATLPQLFFRPTGDTYSTPLPGVYLCSASTPPGGGVHGMCGYHAARRALARMPRL
jgi:phytoene dehydrogenase-like protein